MDVPGAHDKPRYHLRIWSRCQAAPRTPPDCSLPPSA